MKTTPLNPHERRKNNTDLQNDDRTTIMQGGEADFALNSPAVVSLIMGGPSQWAGKTWLLEKNLVLGRSKQQADIYIPEKSLSRRHASLITQKQETKVKDLNSTNGTLLNKKKLPPGEVFTLKNNDLLKMGKLVFKFIESGNIEALSALKVREQIHTDSLCQIHNRKFMEEKGDELFFKCQENEKPLSFILFDLDHFKKINDQYGHLGGDFILSCVAGVVQKLTRKSDIFCRMGGEEFALVVTAPLENAKTLADKIRIAVADEPFKFEGRSISVTISAGVSSLKKEDKNWSALYKRADKASYISKKQGRNKITTAL